MGRYSGGIIKGELATPTDNNTSGVWSLHDENIYKSESKWQGIIPPMGDATFTAVTTSATQWGTGTSASGIDTLTKTFSSVAEPVQTGKRCWFIQTGFRLTNGGNQPVNTSVGLTVGSDSLTEAKEAVSAYNSSVCYYGFSDAYGSVNVVLDITGSSNNGGDGPLFVCYFDNVNSVESNSGQFVNGYSQSSLSGNFYLTQNGGSTGTPPTLTGDTTGRAQIHLSGMNTSNSSSIGWFNASGYTTYLDQDTGTSEYSFIGYRYLIGSSLGTTAGGNIVMPQNLGYNFGTASNGAGATSCVFRMN